jgi:hypothetical protein
MGEGNTRTFFQPLALIMAALLLLSSCDRDDSPEEQVRLFVKTGEEAVGNRDIRAVKKLIAKTYRDERDRTRRDIVAITARYFFSSKNIHVFSRIGELTFPEENRARLLLFVAMAGQNISDLDALLNMQADLYRFDLVLALEEDGWKLISAGWRRAGPDDFF